MKTAISVCGKRATLMVRLPVVEQPQLVNERPNFHHMLMCKTLKIKTIRFI